MASWGGGGAGLTELMRLERPPHADGARTWASGAHVHLCGGQRAVQPEAGLALPAAVSLDKQPGLQDCDRGLFFCETGEAAAAASQGGWVGGGR